MWNRSSAWDWRQWIMTVTLRITGVANSCHVALHGFIPFSFFLPLSSPTALSVPPSLFPSPFQRVTFVAHTAYSLALSFSISACHLCSFRSFSLSHSLSLPLSLAVTLIWNVTTGENSHRENHRTDAWILNSPPPCVNPPYIKSDIHVIVKK